MYYDEDILLTNKLFKIIQTIFNFNKNIVLNLRIKNSGGSNTTGPPRKYAYVEKAQFVCFKFYYFAYA